MACECRRLEDVTAVDFCLMTLTLISVMVLIICGVIVVREYNLAREFLPTQCSVSHVEVTADVQCSHCSTTTTTTFRNGKSERRSRSRCRKSSYPCVMVHVVYDYSGTDKQNGVLHSTAVQLADNNKVTIGHIFNVTGIIWIQIRAGLGP